MRELLARIFGTVQLIFFALLPAAGAGAVHHEAGGAGSSRLGGPAPLEFEKKSSLELAGTATREPDGALRCDPRRIRCGMGRLLDSRGELRLFFPRCLAIAAPVLLFRLKREGFSRCSVEASRQGLLVRGRR